MGTAVIMAERLVPDGTYTVVGSDGFQTTIEIDDAEWATRPSDDGRFPGKPKGTKTAALLIGPNNTRDFQKFCFILPDGELKPMRAAGDRPMRALRALLTDHDPGRFGMEYALTSGRCFRCGRKLTVEASIHRGLGPDCAEAVGEWFATMERGEIERLPPIPTGSKPIESLMPEPQRNLSAIREPEADDTITFAGNKITIRLRWGCPEFEVKKQRIKALGFRWNGEAKVWERTIDAHFVDTQGAMLDHELGILSTWKDARGAILGLSAEADANRAASKAASAAFVANGINAGLVLRPFQAAGVEFMTKKRTMLCADEMGLGKTPESLAAIAHLGCQKTLIVPPASLKLNWRREAKTWVKDAHILVIDGSQQPTKAMLDWATIVIVNYEMADPKKHPWLLAVRWDAVIADECHYLKNPKAQRSANVKRIVHTARGKNDQLVTILLTGTPVLNRPVELWPLLEILGREDAVGGFWPFVKRYCAAHQEYVGRRTVWNMNGASNLVELNDKLRVNGVFLRRVKADVLTELPSKTWATVPVEMSRGGEIEYADAEAETIEWMYRQDARLRALTEEALKEWDGMSQLARERLANGERADALEYARIAFIAEFIASRKARSQAVAQLTQFEGLKSAAWMAKRESVLRWIDDFIAGSDRKLVVFAHHIAVVNEIAERYNAPKIQGGMDQAQVEAGKERFQGDPDCRVIVCNLQAGGVGHTLTAASDVAFVEFPWTPALLDQAVDRVHRIGQLDAVTGWMLIAARREGDAPTIDGIICELLTAKRAVVNAVTDGIAAADEGSVADAVAGRLLAGRGGEAPFEARQEDRVARKFDL